MRIRLAFVLLLATGCATADLRGDAMQTLDPEGSIGRSWLKRAFDAQNGGGLSRGQLISVTMTDTWPNWLSNAIVGPWDDAEQQMRLDVVVGSDDGRITFLNGGEAGQTIGMQNWLSYRQAGPEAAVEVADADDVDDRAKFWVPTVAYFVLMPWRLLEADTVHYMGKTEVGDTTYAKVFVTWGGLELRDGVDQYEIYIDTNTGMIRYARYTVRDFGDFITGTMSYDNYTEFGGVKFGSVMQTVDDAGDTDTNLHRMTVQGVELKPKFGKDALYPAPDRHGKK